MPIEKGKCRACPAPAVKRGLCNMHYLRMKRTHTTEVPEFHRQKQKHPLYRKWISAKSAGCVAEWDNDFVKFLSDVGNPPHSACKLRKKFVAEPIGPSNFRWVAQRTKEEKMALARAGAAKRYYGKQISGEPAWTESQRNSYIQRKFGISISEYESMLAAQNGVCAICRQADARTRLHIDHSHKTGEVRGLLCGSCNLSIGRMGDDPDRLEAAAKYLRRSHFRVAA